MELYKYEGHMDAKPEEIFSILNDDEALKDWSPIFIGNEYFTEEKRAAGTKFRTELNVLNKTYRFRSRIIKYEENQYIKVETKLKQGLIISEFKLSPSLKRETHVSFKSNLNANSNKFNIIIKGAKPVIKRVLDNQVSKLGQIAVR